MAKNNSKVSPETVKEALKAAKATQRPGQSKEQTKLIAQGIQKGIDEYKKQQKVKKRELDKKLKQLKSAQQEPIAQPQQESRVSKNLRWQRALPWLLLIGSWIGFALYETLGG
ncbi:DUF2956 domain-containing protein [Aliikangiella sp. IMCC44653]